MSGFCPSLLPVAKIVNVKTLIPMLVEYEVENERYSEVVFFDIQKQDVARTQRYPEFYAEGFEENICRWLAGQPAIQIDIPDEVNDAIEKSKIKDYNIEDINA